MDSKRNIIISWSSLQQRHTYNNDDYAIFEEIAEVLTDIYQKGVRSGEVVVACGDYYNTLDFTNNGQIIQVGDYLKFEHDNGQTVWKVTGRRFSYAGTPKITLEIQEVVT